MRETGYFLKWFCPVVLLEKWVANCQSLPGTPDKNANSTLS